VHSLLQSSLHYDKAGELYRKRLFALVGRLTFNSLNQKGKKTLLKINKVDFSRTVHLSLLVLDPFQLLICEAPLEDGIL
jgi:hypothetical protein